MIGAIVGDVVGSRFEGMNKDPVVDNFKLFSRRCRFTDDTVLTIATGAAILFGKCEYERSYREYFFRYPLAGYGSGFKKWARKIDDSEAYNSWGNGSAMRVSPVGWAFNDKEVVLEEAEKSAKCSHNHEEGIKGAQSVALSIYLLRNGSSKGDVKKQIEDTFGYDLSPPKLKEWDISCQACVPQAFSAFLQSCSFENCIRLAVLKGGDSDTIAAIAGSMAEAYYGVPEHIFNKSMCYLTKDLKNIVKVFSQYNGINSCINSTKKNDERILDKIFHYLRD